MTEVVGGISFFTMTIHVNIGDAQTRLSELVAAAVRGEEVVLEKSGAPQVRLVAIARPELTLAEREAIVARRMAALAEWNKEFKGFDLSIEALKADRPDPDERERKALGLDL